MDQIVEGAAMQIDDGKKRLCDGRASVAVWSGKVSVVRRMLDVLRLGRSVKVTTVYLEGGVNTLTCLCLSRVIVIFLLSAFDAFPIG